MEPKVRDVPRGRPCGAGLRGGTRLVGPLAITGYPNDWIHMVGRAGSGPIHLVFIFSHRDRPESRLAKVWGLLVKSCAWRV